MTNINYETFVRKMKRSTGKCITRMDLSALLESLNFRRLMLCTFIKIQRHASCYYTVRNSSYGQVNCNFVD